jgi:hypothetical protein
MEDRIDEQQIVWWDCSVENSPAAFHIMRKQKEGACPMIHP